MKKPVIDSWKIIMVTTDDEEIQLDINNDDISTSIDDIITQDYKCTWKD